MKTHLYIAWRNFAGKRLISALTVLSAVTAVAMIGITLLIYQLGYLNLSRALPKDLDGRYACRAGADIDVLKISDLDAVRKDAKGISSIAGIKESRIKLAFGGRTSYVMLYTINPGFIDYSGSRIEGSRTGKTGFTPARNACLIDLRFVTKLKLKPKDIVGKKLLVNGRRMTVAGLMDFPNMMRSTPKEAVFTPAGKGNDPSAAGFSIAIGAGDRRAALASLDASIKKQLGGRNPYECGQMASSTFIKKLFKGLKTGLIISFASVVTITVMIFLSVLCINLAVTLHRRREIAMNALFGADRKAIVIQTMLENIIAAAIGVAAAMAASPPLMLLVLKILKVPPRSVDIGPVALSMGIAASAVFLIMLATSIIPAVRVARLSIAGILKEK